MKKSVVSIAAMAFAIAAGSLCVVSANAAMVGAAGGPSPPTHDSTPPGPAGGGGGGGDSPIKVLSMVIPCPPSAAATHCTPPVVRKPAPLLARRARVLCDNWDYPRVVLPSGRVVIDYDAQKVRFCDDHPNMQ